MASGIRQENKEQHWRGHLAAWQGGGLSIRAYCRQQGLSEPSFYFWRRELLRRDHQACSTTRGATAQRSATVRQTATAQRSASATWMPLAVSQPGSPTVEVHLPEGTVLRIPADVAASTWDSLLTALRRASGEAGDGAEHPEGRP